MFFSFLLFYFLQQPLNLLTEYETKQKLSNDGVRIMLCLYKSRCSTALANGLATRKAYACFQTNPHNRDLNEVTRPGFRETVPGISFIGQKLYQQEEKRFGSERKMPQLAKRF